MEHKLSKGAIIRTIILFITLVNAALALFGIELLPVSEQDVEAAVNVVYAAISAITLIVASIAAWWKNNSFTHAARTADEIMNDLKEMKKKN